MVILSVLLLETYILIVSALLLSLLTPIVMYHVPMACLLSISIEKYGSKYCVYSL